MTEFPPQLPHGELQAIFPDVFFVAGQTRPTFGGRSVVFSRNMTVLRDEGGALTLINTMRLDAEGLARLDALGKVEHIIKLGYFHGRDDAFYVDRYSARLWSFPQMPHERGVKTDAELVPGQRGPLAQLSVFNFETTAIAEGLVLLERHGGVLISCDSLQVYAEPDEYWDEATAALMRPRGFTEGVNLGPGWRNAGKPEARDFARLNALKFRHLLSAHGPPLLDAAHEGVHAAGSGLGVR